MFAKIMLRHPARQFGETVFRAVGDFAKKIPVPAAVKKHVSQKDLAFIAAAYAIPLPGTALFAALIVGGRHLRSRLKPRLATLHAGNG